MPLLNVQVEFNQDSVLRDFIHLSYKDKLFTDCILYCASDQRIASSLPNQFGNENKHFREFRCHRLILSAYSDFFRQFFQSSEVNSRDSACVLLDVDCQTLDKILQLIYHGHVEIPQTELDTFCLEAKKLKLKEFRTVEFNEKANTVDDRFFNHLKRRLTQDESTHLKQSQTCSNNSIELNSYGRNADNTFEPKVCLTGKHDETAYRTAHIDTSEPANTSKANFTCHICQKQYSFKISLNKHIKNTHPTS